MNSRKAILSVILLEFIILALSVFLYSFTVEALQTATRFSGRLSLTIFSLIFLLKKNTLAAWLSEKPYHVFAVAHAIHLVELLGFVYLSEIKLIPTRLIGGILAYLFIFAMPSLSKQKDSGKISIPKFILIEYIFLFYVWFIFFMTYLSRVLGKTPNAGGSYWEHLTLLGWVSVMLGTKLVSLIEFKRSR